jgi:hypothetical protein
MLWNTALKQTLGAGEKQASDCIAQSVDKKQSIGDIHSC